MDKNIKATETMLNAARKMAAREIEKLPNNHMVIVQRDDEGWYHVWTIDEPVTYFCAGCLRPFGNGTTCQNCGNDEVWTG